MLFLVFVALLLAFPVVLAGGKHFASGVFFVSAGVFAMAGYAAAGGLFNNSEDPVSLRLVTLNEPPSISILVYRNDLAEIREHIKYELRRGNITAEKATTLNRLVDEVELEASVSMAAGQVAAHQERTLLELTHAQAKLSEMLADTTNLVKVLGSVSSPEFAGTFIAAKIQVVRLLVERAAIDGSIDEIRQSMKRPKAG